MRSASKRCQDGKCKRSSTHPEGKVPWPLLRQVSILRRIFLRCTVSIVGGGAVAPAQGRTSQVQRPDCGVAAYRDRDGSVLGSALPGARISTARAHGAADGPKLVTPYRMTGKRGKNDAADAAAICEAMQRPNMGFVPIKSEDQQARLMVHRTRQEFVTERTACINRIRPAAQVLQEIRHRALVSSVAGQRARLEAAPCLSSAWPKAPVAGFWRAALPRLPMWR